MGRPKGSVLTPMMKSFVDHYLADPKHVGAHALIKAGYKVDKKNAARMAYTMLNKPIIKEQIEHVLNRRSERLELKAEFLIDKLLTLIDKEGIRDADLIRAIELAGRSIALWKDRQEISGPDGSAIQMEQKVKEDVADFTNQLRRLGKPEEPGINPDVTPDVGTGKVVKLVNGSTEG